MGEERLPRSLGRRLVHDSSPPGPSADHSDEDLLRHVAAGSEEAFRLIWQRYGAAVYSLCLRRLSDPGSAEDATQDTFTSIWRRAVTFDPNRGTATGWVFAVARNATAQLVRRRRPTPGDLTVLDPDETAHEENAVTRLAVHAALTRLPKTERLVIELAYFEDLSHTQIADRLSLPLGTVKTRIRSGLQRLAQYLDEGRG